MLRQLSSSSKVYSHLRLIASTSIGISQFCNTSHIHEFYLLHVLRASDTLFKRSLMNHSDAIILKHPLEEEILIITEGKPIIHKFWVHVFKSIYMYHKR